MKADINGHYPNYPDEYFMHFTKKELIEEIRILFMNIDAHIGRENNYEIITKQLFNQIDNLKSEIERLKGECNNDN